MEQLFGTLPKASISDIIIERIRDALIDGTLKPGDQIPTEIEFSERLGVSRNAVREAIKVMVGYGILEVRRAEGTFVVEKYNSKILDPLLYGVILMDHSIKEILDIKIALANAILYTAISNATDEEVKVLRKYGDIYRQSMHKAKADIEEIYQASKNFHLYLGKICHNQMLVQFDTIIHQIAKFTRIKAIEVSLEENRRDDLPDNYMKEVELLEKRNKHAIPEFMNERLELWKDLLLR